MGESMAEVGAGCDEAQDEKAVAGKVVEMAGVEEDLVIAEKIDGEVFVGGGGSLEAEDSVPAAFGVEQFGQGICAQKGFEIRAVFTDAVRSCLRRELRWARRVGSTAWTEALRER